MEASPPRALVVEDDASLRLLTRVNLEFEGFEVSEAATLPEAEAALAAQRPDVVLLDLHLGGATSYPLLARLRAEGVPVAVVTGSADIEDVRDAADAVLLKPFSPQTLVETAARLARVRANVSSTSILSPAAFESRLQRYLFERAEEWRAVRVGEKEVSEQAEIVRRHGDLFSREQLDALRELEERAADTERELLYRLRKTCEAGLVAAELAEQEDELENRLLAERVTFRGEEMPLRNAQAKLAVLPAYRDREELGSIQADASARFNPDRLELLRAGEALQAEYSGIADAIARNEEEKDISLSALSAALERAADVSAASYAGLRERWFARLLGDERDEVPSSYHTAYIRRLSPLESTYTKERATEVCLQTLSALGFDLAASPNIRLDLEDRPQKSPRACVIASDPPAVVHLITRAQGGLHDYQAFLHEAGHALHYGGCDPALPYTFRRISRDHALTEVYSYIVEAISREPEWHELHFGLDPERAREHAEATTFLEALLYRRYEAKLRFELDFWRRFSSDGGDSGLYERLLSEATGIRYRADNYVADMDAGFYSADYLRAWVRSAQLRAYLVREFGDGWWRSEATGELLRELFREGTKPSSEELASRLGFDPLDCGPLLHEIGA